MTLKEALESGKEFKDPDSPYWTVRSVWNTFSESAILRTDYILKPAPPFECWVTVWGENEVGNAYAKKPEHINYAGNGRLIHMREVVEND
jgi:hypothetical protein